MNDWTLPKLKSHQQWLLGRIDGYRWAKENLNLDVQNQELLIERLVKTEESEREASRLIAAILAEREEMKQAAKDEAAEVHKMLQGGK